MKERTRHLLDSLARFERLVSVLAFVLLVAVVFLDVASREITGTGVHWALQIGVYANLVVVMLGLGIASADGAHLRPRFADRWLPAHWEPVLVHAQEALTGLFFLGFALVGAVVVNETRELAERAPVLGNAVWPLQAIIPLVFALAALRHLAYAFWPDLRPRPTPTFGGGTDAA